MEKVCKVDELKPGGAFRVEVGERAIAVFNMGGTFYAIDDVCSHALASLSEGMVEEDDCMVECPKHGSLFDVRDGKPRSLPATQPVATYQVTVQNDEIYVEV